MVYTMCGGSKEVPYFIAHLRQGNSNLRHEDLPYIKGLIDDLYYICETLSTLPIARHGNYWTDEVYYDDQL